MVNDDDDDEQQTLPLKNCPTHICIHTFTSQHFTHLLTSQVLNSGHWYQNGTECVLFGCLPCSLLILTISLHFTSPHTTPSINGGNAHHHNSQ